MAVGLDVIGGYEEECGSELLGNREEEGLMMFLPFGQEGEEGLEPYEEFVRDHMLVGRRDCPFSRALQRMLDGGTWFEGWTKKKFYW